MTALQDLSDVIDQQMNLLAVPNQESVLRATSDYLERERIDPDTTLYQAQIVYTGVGFQSSNVKREHISTILVLAHRLVDTNDEQTFLYGFGGNLTLYWTDPENWRGFKAPADFIWSVVSLDADEAWTRIGNVMQWSVRAVLATQ